MTVLKGDDQRYPNQHDAIMRIGQSIVRINGEPYFIKSIAEDMTALAWNMVPGTADLQIDVNDDRIDVSSVPLGFMNVEDVGVYVARHPTRSQKQGVQFDNCSTSFMRQVGFHHLGNSPIVLQAYRKAYEGLFPQINEAVGFAFSKTWGLKALKDKSLALLYHKSKPVAIYFVNEDRFKFGKGELTPSRHRSLMNTLSKKGKLGVTYHVEEFA